MFALNVYGLMSQHKLVLNGLSFFGLLEIHHGFDITMRLMSAPAPHILPRLNQELVFFAESGIHCNPDSQWPKSLTC